MKKRLEGLLQLAIENAKKGGALKSDSLPPLILEIPKDPAFGDLATPIALGLARAERRAPRDIAETLRVHLAEADPEGLIAAAEVAGPGYLNLRLSPRFWARCLSELEGPLEIDAGEMQRVLVEFVSGNPTGPLHVGHGRGAVTGDVVARLLAAAGHEVVREYYVNDAGGQMETLGRSTLARLRELYGDGTPFPEDGYPGEYLRELVAEEADALCNAVAAAAKKPCPAEPEERLALLRAHAAAAVPACGAHAGTIILEAIKRDLDLCDIHFDSFVSELELRGTGAIESALADLEKRGLLYDRDGARWFRSSALGDEKDRVVVRASGELTYFAGDIGYHREKLRRGFARLIDVWGADHHGYTERVRAAIEALGYRRDSLQVLLVQIVNLTRGGQPVRMGKRSGEFVTLREVVEEVGIDAARFFFLTRKSDSQLEFDLDLAKQQGTDNPVYYVQYVHARCCSLFRQAQNAGVAVPQFEEIDSTLLSAPEEIELIKQLAVFPDTVQEAAGELEPHRIVFFLIELAGRFHRFYNRHRVLGVEAELGRARLYLVRVARHVTRQGLELLGVRAPESM